MQMQIELIELPSANELYHQTNQSFPLLLLAAHRLEASTSQHRLRARAATAAT